jgi:hypothetical protein
VDEDAGDETAAEDDSEDESEDGDDEELEEEEDKGDEFTDMDRTALKHYIHQNILPVKVYKSMSDDDIREAIRTLIATKTPAAPKKKEVAKKEDKKKAAVPAKKVAQKSVKEEKKEVVKKAVAKKVSTRSHGQKLCPKDKPEDRKWFDPLKKLFPESDYEYAWVVTNGVTIKHRGKNSKRGMLLLENMTVHEDKHVTCNLYLLTMIKQTDVLDDKGIDYDKCWSGAPMIKGIDFEDAIDIITSVLPNISATVQKIDKKLGDNRKRMEAALNEKAAPADKNKKSAKVELKKPLKKVVVKKH